MQCSSADADLPQNEQEEVCGVYECVGLNRAYIGFDISSDSVETVSFCTT